MQVCSYETAGYTVLEMQDIDMAKFGDELFLPRLRLLQQ
jgi:hypothetical protein